MSRRAKIARDCFHDTLRISSEPTNSAPECWRRKNSAVVSVLHESKMSGQRNSSPDCPPELFALTADPSS